MRKFCYAEMINKNLKELEQKDNLTQQEKQEKKCYTKKLQKAEEHLKKFKRRRFRQIRNVSIQ